MSKKQTENVLMENLKLWEKNIIEDYRNNTLKKEIKEVKRLVLKINDSDLRNILDRDCQELIICCNNSAWKATIVMSGSIIEAILLDSLKSERIKAENEYSKIFKNNKKLNEFNLNELIVVSEKLGLLIPRIAKLCDSLRDYRNLIHPGKEMRLSGINVSKSVAEIGKNAVFHLLETLK